MPVTGYNVQSSPVKKRPASITWNKISPRESNQLCSAVLLKVTLSGRRFSTLSVHTAKICTFCYKPAGYSTWRLRITDLEVSYKFLGYVIILKDSQGFSISRIQDYTERKFCLKVEKTLIKKKRNVLFWLMKMFISLYLPSLWTRFPRRTWNSLGNKQN